MLFETQRLIVRKVEERDIPDLYSYGKEDEVVKYQDWGPISLQEARGFYERAQQNDQANPCLECIFVLELKEKQQVIGDIGYFYANPEMKKADVGYNIHPDFWNQGFATEATREMVHFLQEKYPKLTIGASCDIRNIGSKRVLEKSGFEVERIEAIAPEKIVRTASNYIMQVPSKSAT